MELERARDDFADAAALQRLANERRPGTHRRRQDEAVDTRIEERRVQRDGLTVRIGLERHSAFGIRIELSESIECLVDIRGTQAEQGIAGVHREKRRMEIRTEPAAVVAADLGGRQPTAARRDRERATAEVGSDRGDAVFLDLDREAVMRTRVGDQALDVGLAKRRSPLRESCRAGDVEVDDGSRALDVSGRIQR